ncbi:ATP-dependent RNA helicase DDX51-like [Argonauta hians]
MSLFDIKRYDVDASTEQFTKEKYLSRLKNLLQAANKRKNAETPLLETENLKAEQTITNISSPKKKKKRRDKTVDNGQENPDAGDHVESDFVSKEQDLEGSEDVSEKEDHQEGPHEQGVTTGVAEAEKNITNVCSPKKKKKRKDKTENPDVSNHVEPDFVSKEQDLEGSEDVSEKEDHQDGPHEQGEFTILGEYKRQEVQKVIRKLPDWLGKPDLIKSDLSGEKTHISEYNNLDAKLKKKLQENGINYFFPVQHQLLPVLLNDVRFGVNVGCGGYRPRDICCSSPTGSGKTFAFVLPILQSLKDRVVCRVRAIVVLPGRNLAQQVFNVFKTYAVDMNIKVVLIMGDEIFQKEQESLVQKWSHGYESLADIIVATPGKLVDHINHTEGFDLSHLRTLVIDEADRVFDIMKHDWLATLEKAVYKQPTVGTDTNARPKPGPVTINNAAKLSIPFQKLLFSATLTDDSRKLVKVNLFQPRLFLASQNFVSKSSNSKMETESTIPDSEDPDNATKIQKDNVKKEQKIRFILPTDLQEEYMICNPSDKVVALHHYALDRDFHSIVCFTNSIESTHRLCVLLKIMNKFSVAEFSSRLRGSEKKAILSEFTNGSIKMLVCTDSMARGMDLLNVDLVVSYDYPKFVETYIHRVGRTARAGRGGTSVIFLSVQQVVHLKMMRKQCQTINSISQVKLKNQVRKQYLPDLNSAVAALPKSLQDENKKQESNKKT